MAAGREPPEDAGRRDEPGRLTRPAAGRPQPFAAAPAEAMIGAMASRVLLLLALLLGALAPAAAAEGDLRTRLEALADRGDAEAAYHLGMIHHLGLDGAPRDHHRALQYFRRSAEQGDPLGAYKLGCYYAGQGGDVLARDDEQALRYKLVAAEAGYDLAQVEVAQIFHQRGDHARALHWIEASLRQGNMEAIGGAILYRRRGGPSPDGPRAWLYFELMRRDFARIMESVELPEPVSPEEMAEAMDQATDQLRRQVLPEEDEADRARAAPLIEQWREERSPLSIKADEGLNAARRLVGLPLED